MNFSLLRECKITLCKPITAAGTGDTLTTDILDMAGFDAIMFIAITGDVVDTAVGTLTAMHNSVNNTSGATAITGGSVTFVATATSADHKLCVVDVIRPSKRYVYATFQRQVANIPIGGILAIQYRASNVDVTQGTSVLQSVLAGPGV